MSDLSSEREAHVRELLKKATAGDGLVKHMNAVYSFLREAGLMHGPTVLHCRQIGCHSSNRDGLGVNSDHVWELLENIASLGWLKEEATGIVIELGKDGASDSVRAFNTAMVESSMGMSLACSNPNLFPMLSC